MKVKNMTTRQIKKLAQLYAAGVVYNALGGGASSDLLTDEEDSAFAREVEAVALKLAARYADGPLSLKIGSLDGLIKFSKGEK